MIALWVREFLGTAIASTSAGSPSAYLLADRCVACSLLGALRPLWPDGRLVARHPICAGLGRRGAVFCPWWPWPPQAIMGWPRASMPRTRRWAGTAWSAPGVWEVLAGQLGYGVAGPAWPDCPTRCPCSWLALVWHVLFSLRRPRSPVVLTRVRCSCDGPRIKPAPLTDTAEMALMKILSNLEALVLLLGTLVALLPRPLQGGSPCRTGRLQRCMTTVETSRCLVQGFSGAWTRSWKRPWAGVAKRPASRGLKMIFQGLWRDNIRNVFAPALNRYQAGRGLSPRTAQGSALMPNHEAFRGKSG